jgi:hypothetical protein
MIISANGVGRKLMVISFSNIQSFNLEASSRTSAVGM